MQTVYLTGKLTQSHDLDHLIANHSPEFCLASEVSWLCPDRLTIWHHGRIGAICNEIKDWELFADLVERHRIPALAYANLVRHAEKIPVDTLKMLKKRSGETKLQALRLAAEVGRLHKLLGQNGIACIPLKGQLLSQQLYGDPGVRQSKDIDLLVSPSDLGQIHQLLLDEGYTLAESYHNLTPAQANFLLTALHHHEYHHQERGVALELHWRFAYWQEAQMQQFWHDTTTITFGGLDVQVLSNDLQFLYLCDHGASHKWFRLKWLGDVARIIADDRVASWEQLVKLAEQLDLDRSLGQAALLVTVLYGIELPAPLQVLAQRASSRDLARDALEQMLLSTAEVLNSGRRAEGLRMFFYMRRLRPSVPLMTLLRRTLICQHDYQLVRLPDSLFWLYFPLRPFFWLWRNFLGHRSV